MLSVNDISLTPGASPVSLTGDIEVTSLTATPEPATTALLATGLAGLDSGGADAAQKEKQRLSVALLQQELSERTATYTVAVLLFVRALARCVGGRRRSRDRWTVRERQNVAHRPCRSRGRHVLRRRSTG